MKLSSPTLAKTIRSARARSGLSQSAFAKKLGVSQQKLSDWENGKRLRAVIDGINVYRSLLSMDAKTRRRGRAAA